MPLGVLQPFEKGLLRKVARLFRDPLLATTITYKLYQERTKQGTQTRSFQLPAIRSKNLIVSEAVEKTSQQGSSREYIIREKDLPAGVTVKTLNVNDRLSDDGGDFIVAEINKTLGFVIHLKVTGDR